MAEENQEQEKKKQEAKNQPAEQKTEQPTQEQPAQEPVEEKPAEEKPAEQPQPATEPAQDKPAEPTQEQPKELERYDFTKSSQPATPGGDKPPEQAQPAAQPAQPGSGKKGGKLKWGIIIVVILAIIGAVYMFTMSGGDVTGLLTGNGEETSETPASNVEGKVKVDFHVMSQCPYGTQVVDAIAPVLKKVGDNVDFNLYFIGNVNPDGSFSSLHGEPEWRGNMVQDCARKHEPEKYMDMIVCMNENAGAIPGNWEQCSDDNGLDTAKIKECYEGEEGKELLTESFEKSSSVGATGSPTIFINDVRYSGGRSENDFLRAICNSFSEERPEACSEIPEPAKVNMIVLNDERCAECDVTGVVGQINGLFPGMDVKYVDYMSEEGKELYDSTGVTYLPALLFDETISDGEAYGSLEPYLQEAGEYRSLRIGAGFNPAMEICDNEIDDTGNGMVDCDDDECKNSFLCREEIKNDLQVFIMSDCPYGRKAVEALKGVVDNFGDDITYSVHYIASESGDGFSSLHGQYEVDENIRQLCVNKISPEVWFDYLYCRSVNGVKDVDWNTCAVETGVNVQEVTVCFEGEEGKELLREDIKIANGLGIGASPTWIANNRYQFSGIDSETAKVNICTYNTELDGCENVLSSDTGGVAAGSC